MKCETMTKKTSGARARERRIGHLPCSNEGVQDERCSEKALRKLSRSIEEVRLHSRHGQICACVYVLLIRSHSFFSSLSHSLFSDSLSLALFTSSKETSCLRFENNHFLSLILSLSAHFSLVDEYIVSHWFDREEEEEEKEKNSHQQVELSAYQ